MNDDDDYGYNYDDEHPWHANSHDDDGGGDDDGNHHYYDCTLNKNQKRNVKRKLKRKQRKKRLSSQAEAMETATATTTTGATSSSSSFELAVVGKACRIYQDDEMAHKLDQGQHLINYFEDRLVIKNKYDEDSDDNEEENDDGCYFVHYEQDTNTKLSRNGTSHDEKDDSNEGRGMDLCQDDSHRKQMMIKESKVFSSAGGNRNKNKKKKDELTPVLFIDRYDVRALLDDYESFRGPSLSFRRQNAMLTLTNTRSNCKVEEQDEEDEHMLNFERYGQLPEYKTVFLDGENEVSGSNKIGETSQRKRSGHNEGLGSTAISESTEDAETSATEQNREKKDEVKEEEIFELNEKEKRMLPDGVITVSLLRNQGRFSGSASGFLLLFRFSLSLSSREEDYSKKERSRGEFFAITKPRRLHEMKLNDAFWKG